MLDLDKHRKICGEKTPQSYRVITVRLAPELHGRLKDLAHNHHISLNGLCVAALEDAADNLEAATKNSQ